MENYDFKYLHYWQEDIPEEVWSNKIWQETKNEILQRSLLDLARRKETVKKKAKKYNIDEEAVSQFLSGDIFKGISKITREDYENKDEADDFTDKDPREIITELKTKVLTFDNLDKFTEAINNYLKTLSDETQDMLNGYIQNLMDRVTEGKALNQKNLSGYSSEGKVIAALMGKYSNDAFKIPENANEQYNTAMGKVAAIAALIPACKEELTKGMIVRHGEVNSGNKGEIREDIFLLEEIRKKSIAWLREADKTLREVSAGAGLVETHLTALENDPAYRMKWELSHTGTNYYETVLTLDKDLEDIYKKIKYRQPYHKKKAKKDFSIDISDDGGTVRISLGANAKNYEKELTSKLQSYRIKIQDGTPMLTLLGREAGYTGEDMWAILQVASGISRNNDYSRADSNWNFLIKNIGYRSLLNALAGFEKTDDQSFYMVINGNFWTMSDFIEHFINSSSSTGISEIKPDNANRSYGLIRSTYSDLNRYSWQKDIERDGISDDAEDRSDIVWKESLKIMSDTKIRIEITLRDIALLMKKAL